MSEVFTVFYSWQSDTKQNHARHLIREALDIAADAVSQDASNSYQVLVQSDAQGEPGLCNIPETLLRRLRESDAVVSDLTFVAVTTGDEPKHCSNPNVLFELGYAFGQIGPERLICVMNEAHGPAAKQIFDLAHHRRPISFVSSNEKGQGTRKETIAALAKELETALRGVLKLGLVGGSGGDDEIRHQRALSEIQSFHQPSENRIAYPRIEFVFRPTLFRQFRWPDAETLEALLREIGPYVGRHHYPPVQTGTAPMDWGLFNDTYRHPWAFTYAGQFWTEIVFGESQTTELSDFDTRTRSVQELVDSSTIPAGRWGYGKYALSQLGAAFHFSAILASRFADSEQIQIDVSVRNMKDCWLEFENDKRGPCRAPSLLRQVQKTASEFRKDWMSDFAMVGKSFTDLFNRDGRVFSADAILSICELTVE
ncbi:hypothetical protein [Stieleria neptunia]|nr:hypothetical protein [Stieleria neptunia]